MSPTIPSEARSSDLLRQIGLQIQQEFAANRRVLSFPDYLQFVRQSPRSQLRSAAQYLHDVFDHYGTTIVEHPFGKLKRFRLFDAPWDDGRARLIGQEEVLTRIYRILSNFVRQGRVDRFILLHGPNGSSKSTITDLLARAMEHYSALDEGSLYRFTWIFPKQTVERSGIGFSRSQSSGSSGVDTFAHLDDSAIDARMPCDLRDHPLFLLPKHVRTELLKELGGELTDFVLSDYLTEGDLCHRCKPIFESLLSVYEGDYLRVLRHVQVERYFVSRRYRLGAARVEPQMAADARVRQVTADRSLSSLPPALQGLALYESEGDLVRANRGLIDFADLFKRPLEAFKYLLTTVETGQVVIDQANVFLDAVFIGSANETQLNGFMETSQWTSFKGRMELIRVPYLRDHHQERQIYDSSFQSLFEKPLSPRAIDTAAYWAVLTRMRKPDPSLYDEELRPYVAKLTPQEKAQLYADGKLPELPTEEIAKLMRANIPRIYREAEASQLYEGRTGASAREIRSTILNAAQNPDFPCLSPEAVLTEIERLVQDTSVYDFLRQEVQSPGYHDHREFIEVVRRWYLEQADNDIRGALGLVEEASYVELFSRYIVHVTHYVRQEKVQSSITGDLEDPDQRLMKEVERHLAVEGDVNRFRQNIMTRIGAWSIDHPDKRPDYAAVFPEYFHRLRDDYFKRQQRVVQKRLRQALDVLAGDFSSLPADDLQQVRKMLKRLHDDYGYTEAGAHEMLTHVLKSRYEE